MHRRFRLGSAILPLLLLIASCGGGDDDGDASALATTTTSETPAPGATEDATEEAEANDTEVDDTGAAAEDTVADEPQTATDEAEVDDGETVVALDEQAAFALLSLDIAPDVVLTTLSSETFARLNEQLGIESVEFVIAEPSFELLAGLQPDVLVSIGSPWVVDRVDDFEQVAPLVVAPVDVTWQEQLTAFASQLDAVDRADAVIAAVDGFEADVASALATAGAGGTSISVLTARVGNIVAVNSGGAIGQLLLGVGLDRPEPQLSEGVPGIPFDFISDEVLSEHDADVLVVAQAAIFDVEPLVSSPIYEQLSVVQRGDTHDVVADAWVLGGHGFATFWLLQDLSDLLVDGGAPATLDDTEARWASFLELLG
ncbi:MAG: ABC transporter substrate-binding protein [Actinomycetota bacterium]